MEFKRRDTAMARSVVWGASGAGCGSKSRYAEVLRAVRGRGERRGSVRLRALTLPALWKEPAHSAIKGTGGPDRQAGGGPRAGSRNSSRRAGTATVVPSTARARAADSVIRGGSARSTLWARNWQTGQL